MILSAVNAQNLFLVNSLLKFDTNILKFDNNFQAGSLFGDNPVIDVQLADVANDIINIGISPGDDASPGVNGDGSFLKIQFTRLEPNATQLIWLPDSGAYAPDDSIGLRRLDDTSFTDYQLTPTVGNTGLIIFLNAAPIN